MVQFVNQLTDVTRVPKLADRQRWQLYWTVLVLYDENGPAQAAVFWDLCTTYVPTYSVPMLMKKCVDHIGRLTF
jgi:hypothetical protein